MLRSRNTDSSHGQLITNPVLLGIVRTENDQLRSIGAKEQLVCPAVLEQRMREYGIQSSRGVYL